MRQPFEITETNANFTRGSGPFVVVWCVCQKLGCGAPSDTNTSRFTKKTLERKTVAGLLLIFVFAPGQRLFASLVTSIQLPDIRRVPHTLSFLVTQMRLTIAPPVSAHQAHVKL